MNRYSGSLGRPQRAPSHHGFHLFKLIECDVEGRLLVQATGQGFCCGEVAVLEKLVAGRAAPAEREVTAGFLTHIHAPADLVIEDNEPRYRQHGFERVPRYVAKREAAVPWTGEAQQFGRIGREIALVVHVEDREGPALLRPRVGLLGVRDGVVGAVELPHPKRRIRRESKIHEAGVEPAEARLNAAA